MNNQYYTRSKNNYIHNKYIKNHDVKQYNDHHKYSHKHNNFNFDFRILNQYNIRNDYNKIIILFKELLHNDLTLLFSLILFILLSILALIIYIILLFLSFYNQ